MGCRAAIASEHYLYITTTGFVESTVEFIPINLQMPTGPSES